MKQNCYIFILKNIKLIYNNSLNFNLEITNHLAHNSYFAFI